MIKHGPISFINSFFKSLVQNLPVYMRMKEMLMEGDMAKT